jgi:tyrosine-specific transport protein
MFKSTDNVNTFLNYLAIATNYGSAFLTLSKVFIFFSVTTSFLGVGLGLFEFVAETFKFGNTAQDRLKTALISFAPPLFFAIFYPNGFILALGYAAIALSILAIIMPCFIAMIVRTTYAKNDYQAPGGNALLWVAILIGFLIIAIEIMKKFGMSFI